MLGSERIVRGAGVGSSEAADENDSHIVAGRDSPAHRRQKNSRCPTVHRKFTFRPQLFNSGMPRRGRLGAARLALTGLGGPRTLDP